MIAVTALNSPRDHYALFKMFLSDTLMQPRVRDRSCIPAVIELTQRLLDTVTVVGVT